MDKHIEKISALQFFIGSFLFIKAFDITYSVKIDGTTTQKIFYSPFPFIWVTVLLLLIWLVWVQSKHPLWLISPLFTLTLYYYIGIEGAMSISSILGTIIFLIYSRKFEKFLRALFIIVFVIEFFSMFHWLIEQPLTSTNLLRSIAIFELDLYYILTYFAPLLVIILLFSWIIRPLYSISREHVWQYTRETKIYSNPVTGRTLFFLCLILLLGVFTAIYPYNPNINPDGRDVGVDIRRYTKDVKLVSANITSAFTIQNGSRPLIFLSVLGFQELFNLDSLNAVRFFPVILLPLFYLVVFLLCNELYHDAQLALVSTFLTATGYQVTVTLYAHFITNIQALFFLFLSLTFLFRAIRLNDRRFIPFSLLMFILVEFTHPWTYLQYLGSIGLALGYRLLRSKFDFDDRITRILFLFVGFGVGIDVFKRLVVKGAGSGFAVSMAVERFAEVPSFWFHSLISSQIYYGGLLSNLILIVLAIIGVYYLDVDKIGDSILFFLLTASAPLYLIGNKALKSRLLLNQPIGIIAAIGLVSILRNSKYRENSREIHFFVLVSMIVYLFRSIANIL